MTLYTQLFFFFFFNDTATTEIYTLSLHDALPIWRRPRDLPPELAVRNGPVPGAGLQGARPRRDRAADRKSTRLNSSHSQISYAVFCLKKKKKMHSPSSDYDPQVPPHRDIRAYIAV